MVSGGGVHVGEAVRARSRSGAACSRGGLTLVEVLVASILLGIGVAGLVSSASLALRNQQRTDLRAQAIWLASERMGTIDMIGAHTYAMGYPDSGTESRPDAEYRWTVQVEETGVPELFKVRVDVEWTAASGSGSVELETLLNDYEAISLIPQNQREQPRQPEMPRPR